MLPDVRNLAYRYVSMGAAELLQEIVKSIYSGKTSLSNTFFCREFGLARDTVIKRVRELEKARLIRVRRAYLNHKVNATNRFAIDFKGPLGAIMPRSPPSKKIKEINKNNVPNLDYPPMVGRLHAQSKKIEQTDKNNVPNLDYPSMVGKVFGTIEQIDKIGGQKLDTYSINTRSDNGSFTDRTFPMGMGARPVGRAPISGGGFDKVEDAIAFATKRTRKVRAEKVAKAVKPEGHIRLSGVKAQWEIAMLQHYPTVPPVILSVKEFAILKRILRPIVAFSSVSDFFDFIVSSWHYMRVNKFNWLRAQGKDITAAPSLSEVIRYFRVFTQAYADRRIEEANNRARSVLTPRQVLQGEVKALKDSKAILAGELSKTKERLERAEKIAFGKRHPSDIPMAERVKFVDGDLDEENNQLPDWKDDE
jgi:DNA-binding Lrp family transcriptional regulator